MHRTLIAGGPRVGKTTLAAALAREVGVVSRHTDDLVGAVAYAEAHKRVAEWISPLGPWVIEGVTVVRALRLWLRDNPTGIPAERVFWSTAAKVDRTTGQARMAKGIATVWGQIEPELLARGVVIQTF